MSLLEGLVALAVPLVLGAGLMRAVGAAPRTDGLLTWCGRVFPLGATALALVLFAFMAAGVTVRGPVPGITAALLGVALLLVPRRRPSTAAAPQRERRPAARIAAALLVVSCLATVAFVAAGDVRRPVHRDDDALIWGMKARYLYHHGVFDDALGETLADPTRGGHHLDYPLLNPLLQVWVTSLAGGYVEHELRWPTMAWMVSLTLLLLGATRRRCGAVTGSLLSLALVGVGVVWVVGTGAKSDLITALALLGALDAGARWIEEDGGRRHAALAASFTAVLVWSKNEGLMLAAVLLVAAAMTRPLRMARGLARPSALFFLAPAAVAAAQAWLNRRYGLANDLLTGGGVDDRPLATALIESFPERFGPIARAYAGNMAFWIDESGEVIHRFDYHNGLYLAFFVLVAACPVRAMRGAARLVTLTCLGGLAAYFLVYVVSYQDLAWHLFTSLPRVQSHLLPGMVLGIAILLRDLRADARAEISAPQRETMTEPRGTDVA